MLASLVFAILAQGELDKLVDLYRAYHLPAPPVDAPLVELSGITVGDGKTVACGYLVKRVGNYRARIWVGSSAAEMDSPGREIAPIPESAKRLAFVSAFSLPFDEDVGLAITVIEKTRGHDAFAQAIWDIAKKNRRFFLTPRDVNVGPSVGERMQDLAVSHWLNTAVDPEADRGVVLFELRALAGRNPKVATVSETKAALEGLDPKQRYTGTDPDEKLIDALCDAQVTGDRLSSEDPAERPKLLPVLAIVDRGFAIVPKLIAHIQDKRLTRAVHPAIMNARASLCAVGDVCDELIQGMRDLPAQWSWRHYASPKAAVMLDAGVAAWWAKASKMGERAYCLQRLSNPADQFPSEALVRIAEKRHPDILPIAYTALTRLKRKVQTYSLLEAMERTGISKAQIAQLSLLGASHPDLDQVHAALWTLKNTDRKLFDQELVKTLTNLPSRATGEAWLSREASFAQIAGYSTTPEVWAALAAATKRANVDLRLELIQHSAYVEFTPSTSRLWLQYLLAFMGDESVASATKPKNGEIPDDQHFGTLSTRVRDLATGLAAQHFGWKLPAGGAPRSDWDRLRENVKKKIPPAVHSG